jgi:hypothetical protein
MDFATHFPLNCPPSTALPVGGEIFRLIKRAPASASDFVSLYVRSPNGRHPARLVCEAYGLTVFLTENDIRAAREISPYFKMRSIAKARVTPGWGVLQVTRGGALGRHTWWVPNGMAAENIFEAVESA